MKNEWIMQEGGEVMKNSESSQAGKPELKGDQETGKAKEKNIAGKAQKPARAGQLTLGQFEGKVDTGANAKKEEDQTILANKIEDPGTDERMKQKELKGLLKAEKIASNLDYVSDLEKKWRSKLDAIPDEKEREKGEAAMKKSLAMMSSFSDDFRGIYEAISDPSDEKQAGKVLVDKLMAMDKILLDAKERFPEDPSVEKDLRDGYYRSLGSGDIDKGKKIYELLDGRIKTAQEGPAQLDLNRLAEDVLKEAGPGGLAGLLSSQKPAPLGEKEDGITQPAPLGAEGGGGILPEDRDGAKKGVTLPAPGDGGKPPVGPTKDEVERRKGAFDKVLKDLLSKKSMYRAGTAGMILLVLFFGMLGEFSEIVERTMERVITGRTVA